MMEWLKKLMGGGGKPVPETVATVQKLPGNIYVLRLGGVLNKATVDRIQAIAAHDLAQGSKDLKMLVLLDDFRGWRQGDAWGDIDFFAQHEASISRIAVVGDPRWESETLAFLGAGHRTGTVRFFTPGRDEQARAWLIQQG
jgi:hypothetical protein